MSGIYPGNAKGTITYNDKTQNFSLLVKSGTTLDSPQRLNLTFDAAGGSKVLPILAAIMGLAVIIGLIDLIFISKGGFKANIDKALHHGGGESGTTSSTNSSMRHSASFSRDTNDHITPGIIVEPSSNGTNTPWNQ